MLSKVEISAQHEVALVKYYTVYATCLTFSAGHYKLITMAIINYTTVYNCSCRTSRVII